MDDLPYEFVECVVDNLALADFNHINSAIWDDVFALHYTSRQYFHVYIDIDDDEECRFSFAEASDRRHPRSLLTWRQLQQINPKFVRFVNIRSCYLDPRSEKIAHIDEFVKRLCSYQRVFNRLDLVRASFTQLQHNFVVEIRGKLFFRKIALSNFGAATEEFLVYQIDHSPYLRELRSCIDFDLFGDRMDPFLEHIRRFVLQNDHYTRVSLMNSMHVEFILEILDFWKENEGFETAIDALFAFSIAEFECSMRFAPELNCYYVKHESRKSIAFCCKDRFEIFNCTCDSGSCKLLNDPDFSALHVVFYEYERPELPAKECPIERGAEERGCGKTFNPFFALYRIVEPR